MSSTSNVQSVLTSVLRPVYNYDATNYFTTKLNISNVNTVYADIANVTRADVGDINSNVYVGIGSGNAITSLRSCYQNTAVGYNAGSLMSNSAAVVALGYNSGYAANTTSNSIFIGRSAGVSSVGCTNNIAIDPSGGVLASTSTSNTIAIGARVGTQSSHGIFIGNSAGYGTTGASNIVIGHYSGSSTAMTGSNNMLIGSGLTMASSLSNTMYIGNRSNVLIAGNLASNGVAIGKSDAGMYYIGTTTPVPGLVLDVAGYARFSNGLAIGRDPLQYTLDVNGSMRIADGYGSLVMYHDASLNPRLYESGTVQATSGVFSVQGTSASTGSAVTIGTLRYGKNDILINSSSDPTKWEACSYMWLGSGAPVKLTLSNDAGTTPVVTFSSSNIQASSSTQPWLYTITYFPLPPVGTYAPGTSSGPA